MEQIGQRIRKNREREENCLFSYNVRIRGSRFDLLPPPREFSNRDDRVSGRWFHACRAREAAEKKGGGGGGGGEENKRIAAQSGPGRAKNSPRFGETKILGILSASSPPPPPWPHAWRHQSEIDSNIFRGEGEGGGGGALEPFRIFLRLEIFLLFLLDPPSFHFRFERNESRPGVSEFEQHFFEVISP